MSLLFADGFDHYATAEITTWWTQIYGAPQNAPAITASVGRRSTQALRFSFTNVNTRPVSISLTPGDATCVIGFSFVWTGGSFSDARTGTALNINAFSGSQQANMLVGLLQGGSGQIYFQITTSGTISVYRLSGTTGTLLGTGSIAMNVGVTTYLEFKVLIHASAGTIDIRHDGISSLALTGQNTRGTSTASYDEVAVGHMVGVGATSRTVDIDDLYIADGTGSQWNTFKGDVRVDVRRVTANGTNRDFTPSTGSDDYAVVDETLVNGDTDYLESSTVSHKVDMVTEDAAVSGADIHGVIVAAYARKTDAGAAGHKALVRIGSTDYVGTEVGLTSSYSFKLQVWELSPATGVAWTESEFNGAKFGAQKSA